MEKHRPWVRKHLHQIFIVTGLLITILGGLLPYWIFATAPSYSFKSGFSGFGIARNDTNVSPTLMVVGLGAEPPELWFEYFCGCFVNGTYNFLFFFPFKIVSEEGNSTNMSFRTTQTGSAVWLSLNINDVYLGLRNTEIWGDFSIENTFQSGSRGVYTFILPFGMGIDSSVTGDLLQNLDIFWHKPDANITLQVGLPGRYDVLGTFPPPLAGPNEWTTPTNRTISSMEWQFATLQDSVTIHSQDSGEVGLYEGLPLISGVFIGIGFPMITSTIYDAVKEWSRRQRRGSKNKSAQENGKKGSGKENPVSSGYSEESRQIGKIDKIFELCLLLVTVIAAAELQYASLLYSLKDIDQVNFLFRVSTIPIIILVTAWIGIRLIPSIPRRTILVRRFTKEFCWTLFGNLFVLEILNFVYLSFSKGLFASVLWGQYGTLISVLLTFPATWQYRKADQVDAQNQTWTKFAWKSILEHIILYFISYGLLRYIVFISGSMTTP